MEKPVKAHSFIGIIKKASYNKKNIITKNIEFRRDCTSYSYTSDDNQMEIAFAVRNSGISKSSVTRLNNISCLILGDDSEWPDSVGQRNMANAVFIEYDLKTKHLKCLSSIVGLPPAFIYESTEMVIVTSDLHFLTTIPELGLYFCRESLIDLSLVGHPIDNRTLFKDVNMIPAGHLVNISREGKVDVARSWSLPETDLIKDWKTYIEAQIVAFKKAMKNIDLSNSFLSLTAGLDTRAILATLVQDKITLSSYTMSGKNKSLDAITASNLSKAYGMKHKVVILDSDFHKDLHGYAMTASRLSGGLSSVEQAHEVYFYKNINGTKFARLSGNMGNQVGRRGTENISMRNADISILNEQLIKSDEQRSINHWYTMANLNDGGLDYDFLLRNEIPFSSVGNYSIGNYFAVQQSPYASSLLIETSQRVAKEERSGKPLSLTRMRLRDLGHRFLGESELQSFQVKLIKEIGGYVASCPINWGWRAKGGISLPGFARGGLTFLDAIIASRGFDSGLLYRGLEVMHIAGLHEFKRLRLWMNIFMREFVHDTLLSTLTLQSGIFNEKRLKTVIEEHYSGEKCHLKALTLALDIALAKASFGVPHVK